MHYIDQLINPSLKIFLECQLIMCWFHLKQNIRKKRLKIILAHKYFTVKRQINELHHCLSKQEHDQFLSETLHEYKYDNELNKFYKYFNNNG